MFDLTADTIDRPFRDKHAAATIVSATSHVMVLGSIIAAILFSVPDKLPEVPTMVAFVAEMPAPPPPPPPPLPPTVRAQRESQPTSPAPASGPTFTVPAEIPTGIPPESAVDLGGEGGVAGGVPGGIPGGVFGGVLGGIVSGESLLRHRPENRKGGRRHQSAGPYSSSRAGVPNARRQWEGRRHGDPRGDRQRVR